MTSVMTGLERWLMVIVWLDQIVKRNWNEAWCVSSNRQNEQSKSLYFLKTHWLITWSWLCRKAKAKKKRIPPLHMGKDLQFMPLRKKYVTGSMIKQEKLFLHDWKTILCLVRCYTISFGIILQFLQAADQFSFQSARILRGILLWNI